VSELAMLSATGTGFAEVDPGTRIVAVRPDGGDAEIRGRRRDGGGEALLRIAPTDRDMGWVAPPGDVVWTGFRAVREEAACHVELAPLGEAD
jgi:hypothetical protein